MSCDACGSYHVIETKHNIMCRFCGKTSPKVFHDPSGVRVANSLAPITKHDRVVEAMRNAGKYKK